MATGCLQTQQNANAIHQILPQRLAAHLCHALKKIIISLFNAPFSYYCIISLSQRDIRLQFRVIPVTCDFLILKRSNVKTYPVESLIYMVHPYTHITSSCMHGQKEHVYT